jgi:2-polyprenyl-3-methyl-5-hydroxy-6-metoxy-1,4-benzoquinol methylase
MILNESLRVQEVRLCFLCGSKGMLLYQNLRDRLFGIPGVWNFLRCPHCGFVWLNPRPIFEDLNTVYRNYFTHVVDESCRSRMGILQEKIALPILATMFGYKGAIININLGRRIVGILLGLIPLLKDIANSYVMGLYEHQRGRLLDIGCGNGRFIARMKKLGWNVVGVEPDPEAAKIALKHFGISVYVGTLERVKLPSDSFDAITMNDVIEHVDDPISLLQECYRILKPSGKLIITTPNIESLGHRIFGVSWRELDPPRHFYLFSLRTLWETLKQVTDNKFRMEELRTISINAGEIWPVSKFIAKKGKWTWRRLLLREMIEGLIFLFVEELARLFSPKSGEKIMMIVTKET